MGNGDLTTMQGTAVNSFGASYTTFAKKALGSYMELCGMSEQRS